MQSKSMLLGAAALGAMLALGVAASANATPVKHKHPHHAAAPADDGKLTALTSEVETLESRLEAETLARQQLEGQVQAAQSQAAAAQADANSAHAQLAEQIQTIPGEVKAQVAAAQPKGDRAHYKGVDLTLGGFAAAESVYRSKNEEADIGSSFAKIPFANATLAHTNELRATARQSRLSLLAEGDIDPNTRAGFYTELDFLAGPQTANSNESNSFSPRIRNIYGTLDTSNWHFLAGQNWSLATMNTKGITPRNELPPPTIEAQYVVGFAWARQPQLRVTGDFDNKQLWASVSLENPQTTFASAATGTTGTSVSGLTVTTTATSASQFDNTVNLSLNHVPDVIAKVAFEPDIGGSRPVHAELFGLYRSYYDRVNVTTATNLLGLPVGITNQNTSGGGIGGGVTWTVVPKLIDLEVSGLTGRGIGRYGSGQLPDTVVAPNGSLKPITESMFMAGGTLHATPALDLYVFGGEERENAAATTIGANHYGYGSPFANLTACAIEGGSCTPDVKLETQITGGLWDKIYQGKFGSVRFGLQYSYTQLTAFGDVNGFAPKTSENMVFTSFRYYPF